MSMTSAMLSQLEALYTEQLWSSLAAVGHMWVSQQPQHQHQQRPDMTAHKTVVSGHQQTPHQENPTCKDAEMTPPEKGSSPPPAGPSTGGSGPQEGTGPDQLASKTRSSVLMMIAEALLQTGQYQKAEVLLKEVLAARKIHGKVKTSAVSDDAGTAAAQGRPILTDIEIKWKLYLCYKGLGQSGQAASILQSIPARKGAGLDTRIASAHRIKPFLCIYRQRTARVNMALAKIYEDGGIKRSAMACYKEVLKACPLALDVAKKLMQLGVKAREIQELTLDAANECDWLNPWIQSYSQYANSDYQEAVQGRFQLSINSLERFLMFKNDVSSLVLLGKSQYYKGDYTKAQDTLERAHSMDPGGVEGMDVLAALYAREKKSRELEALATKLIGVTESAPESWIAMGYFCFLSKKGSRAVYFGHKACMLDQKNVEALLLKGIVLLDLKKTKEALNHFREGLNLAPNRFELNKGLVDCYLAQERYREALNIAATASKTSLNKKPRELTLYASVLARDGTQASISKAKGHLEKVLSLEPTHLPAVYLLVEILEQEMNVEDAISLLQRQLKEQSTAKLHHMLADLLAKTHEEEKAMEHYTYAVNLDPKNESAQKGLQKMEQSADTPLEVTYDLEMEDVHSEAEGGDLDESETEAVWSDGELNLATSNTSSRYL